MERKSKSMEGCGIPEDIFNALKSVHGFAKKNQLLSRGLDIFGQPKFAAAARSLGYGQKGSGLKEDILASFKRAHDYVKKNKIASKGLSLFGHEKLAKVADSLGYGQSGKGLGEDIWNGLKSVHDFIKKNKVVSKGLKLFGEDTLAEGADSLGYGGLGYPSNTNSFNGQQKGKGRGRPRKMKGGEVYSTMTLNGLAPNVKAKMKGGLNGLIPNVKEARKMKGGLNGLAPNVKAKMKGGDVAADIGLDIVEPSYVQQGGRKRKQKGGNDAGTNYKMVNPESDMTSYDRNVINTSGNISGTIGTLIPYMNEYTLSNADDIYRTQAVHKPTEITGGAYTADVMNYSTPTIRDINRPARQLI